MYLLGNSAEYPAYLKIILEKRDQNFNITFTNPLLKHLS